MKNLIKLFLLSIIALCVIGCANPANNSNGDDKKKPVDTTELKMALYEKVLGSWTLDDYKYTYDNIVFSSDSITLDGTKYDLNPEEDFFLEQEIPEEKKMEGTLYFNVGTGLHYIDYDTSLTDITRIVVAKLQYFEVDNSWAAPWNYFVKVSGGNSESGGGENLDFSVVGDWGYKINGTTDSTLKIKNDGSFIFTTTSGTYNGSYSLSGNKITFEFDQNASMNIKDTFTISGSEDEITLTLVESISTYNGNEQKSTALSGMLNAFYGVITSTSITLSK